MAISLHLWIVIALVASVRQMLMALGIDYDQPVTSIQKQVEQLRKFRVRFTQWALLSGQLVWWIPLLIVALKGIWGNLAFGVAAIPLAIWISRRWAQSSPLARQLSGYNLNRATAFLASIAEFEGEERIRL